MIIIKNTQRRTKLNIARIRRRIQTMLDYLGYHDVDINVWFTTNKTIRGYNNRYRHKNVPTDILSFPFIVHTKNNRATPPDYYEKILGDLMISPEFVRKIIKASDITLEERLDQLFAHGICHLLGYSHDTPAQDKRMRKQEQTLLKLLNPKQTSVTTNTQVVQAPRE